MCMQKNGEREKLPAFPYPTWYNGDSSKYKCGECTPSCGLILSWEIVGKYEGEEKKNNMIWYRLVTLLFTRWTLKTAVKAF